MFAVSRFGRALVLRIVSLGVALLVGAGSLLAIFQDVAPLMRNHKETRYLITPANYLYSLARVLSADASAAAKPRQPIGLDAALAATWQQRNKPALFVIVVGETARAANWGFEAANVGGLETPDMLGCPKDISAHRMAFVDHLFKLIKNELRRGIVVGIDLIDYNLLLLFQLLLGEGTINQDVAEQFNSAFIILAKKRGMNGCLLLRGIGIHLSPNVLQPADDVIGLSFRSTLEDGMLNEMRHPLLFGRFIPRTGIDDHSAVRNGRID